MSSAVDQEISREHLKRVPKQERSQQRFETIIAESMRLFAESGYEAVSMREIARECGMPIATVYQYFPTKQAIVKEIWLRYSDTVRERLEGELSEFLRTGDPARGGDLIDSMVDLLMALQLASPAYVEIWACVGATPELRELNDRDTLHTADRIMDAILGLYPDADREMIGGMALILAETAGSITKLTLSVSEEERERILRRSKLAMRLLYDSTMAAYAGPRRAPE